MGGPGKSIRNKARRITTDAIMKPLKSADPNPHSVQFSHFGVLNDGANSKGAFIFSAVLNSSVLFILVLISLAVVNRAAERKEKLTVITLAHKEEPPKPPPPKIVPPKPLPEPPKPVQPPKIQPPPVQLPPELKPIVVPTPKVNLTPPAPKKVDPPPAPKVVSLANAHAASIVNNDAKASAVKLGNPTSPVNPTGPAVSRVNLSAGMPGMPTSNTGNGPPSKTVNLGNGSPQGTNLQGRSAAITPIKGLNNGVPGGTGTGTHGPVSVQIAPPQQVAAATRPTPVVSPMAHGPVVTSFPKPVYTAEARAAHIEGDARVSVRFLATGNIQVLGLVNGLGHGLDQAALTAAQGIHFKPAMDASGQPIDYTETITIHFLLLN
jgi:TonB family protein